MSTYTQIIYQIVFATKHREKTLIKEKREDLYKFIWGLLKNKNCVLYQVGGIEDHIHILTHIHPSISLSALVKDIKLGTTDYIKTTKIFPDFSGWQNGYGAFTYAERDKAMLMNYIKNQESHHHKKTFKEEYMNLLEEHQINFEEKYLL